MNNVADAASMSRYSGVEGAGAGDTSHATATLGTAAAVGNAHQSMSNKHGNNVE